MTAVDKSAGLQVHRARDIEHQVAAGLGHARQDPAFGLFFACKTGPFDLVFNLACGQFAHAGPASAIAARVGEPDAGSQARLQQGHSSNLFKLQTRGLDFYQECFFGVHAVIFRGLKAACG